MYGPPCDSITASNAMPRIPSSSGLWFGSAAREGERRFALNGRGSIVTKTEMRSESQGQSMKPAFLPNPMMLRNSPVVFHLRNSFETKVTSL